MTPVTNLKPNQPPYWIIVSEEGPATHPVRHATRQDADREAERLTTKHPGHTFTVFKAEYALKTPTAATEKTTYAYPVSAVYGPYWWYGYPRTGFPY